MVERCIYLTERQVTNWQYVFFFFFFKKSELFCFCLPPLHFQGKTELNNWSTTDLHIIQLASDLVLLVYAFKICHRRLQWGVILVDIQANFLCYNIPLKEILTCFKNENHNKLQSFKYNYEKVMNFLVRDYIYLSEIHPSNFDVH